MKRYRIQIIERENYKASKYSQEHKLGGWCKWADVKELEAEIKRLTEQVANLAKLIHYPEHWDTACYHTLEDALHEIGCSECRS